MEKKQIIVTAAIFGLLGVLLGALGTHILRTHVNARQLEMWQIGIQYQFYHTFALLFLSTLTGYKTKLVKHAYYLFSAGIILFSGSLYLIACNDMIGWTWVSISFTLTPLGGVMFIGGWGVLILACYKVKFR